MEEDAKRRLKSAELQAKKERLRIWTNYVPPATNSKAIHDQNFTGKVRAFCLKLFDKVFSAAKCFYCLLYLHICLSPGCGDCKWRLHHCC